jgi:hypothetical protein
MEQSDALVGVIRKSMLVKPPVELEARILEDLAYLSKPFRVRPYGNVFHESL